MDGWPDGCVNVWLIGCLCCDDYVADLFCFPWLSCCFSLFGWCLHLKIIYVLHFRVHLKNIYIYIKDKYKIANLTCYCLSIGVLHSRALCLVFLHFSIGVLILVAGLSS